MRLFAIADPHGNYSKIEELLRIAGDVDVVLIAGDITNFGPDEKALELFEKFSQKILAVPGNCDHESIIKVVENSNAINLHKGSIFIDGVRFIGMGGSNPTPFCTPFEIQECDFEENVSHMLENVEANEVLVTLTHTPPFGVLDMVGYTHVGCKALKVFLDRADLMICGHIHEARGIERSGKTIIVNPGMAALGFAAIIDIDIENNKTNIDVKLIESDREVN
ncbi:metallophosphoesterase family protein [Methanolobus bombayensis]|uniref:metallophosphoesterase family protein n=1 Tax=Methanolobus bombayensis TaxID=38023 RepID=UPI001AE113E1|nr:metallophosphoesterase [Methanolobus bombayensis]MBP1910009.1 Icc-related predicted phosphoesterase [Methanolobus bombayensis]